MRMVLTAQIPVEAGNEAIKNGTMSKIIENVMAALKPEATYFTANEGERTASFYFDMQDSSQLPVYCEPFFLDLNAKVTVQPAMNADDVRKGLTALQSGT